MHIPRTGRPSANCACVVGTAFVPVLDLVYHGIRGAPPEQEPLGPIVADDKKHLLNTR